MACRLMKPSDSIIVLHVPLLELSDLTSPDDAKKSADPFRYKHVENNSSNNNNNTNINSNKSNDPLSTCRFLTLEMYERMHRKASGKVDHLIGFYKAAGVNIFVDEMPSFVSECDRVLRNSFHKTTVESLSDASAAAHASLPYEYDYKKTIAQMQKSDERPNKCASTIQKMNNIYYFNQNRKFLSHRIHKGQYTKVSNF